MTMSDTEDIQRGLTAESQPDDAEKGEVQTTSGESKADYNSESETETETVFQNLRQGKPKLSRESRQRSPSQMTRRGEKC